MWCTKAKTLALFYLLVSATLFCLPAHAQKESVPDKSAKANAPVEPFFYSDGQSAHIIQMDPDFPVEKLKREGIVVHTRKQARESQETLPSRVQARLFREAGLDELVKGWSGLDKDLLCLRAEHQSAEEAASRFDGKVPLPLVSRLKDLLSRYRSGFAKNVRNNGLPSP